MHKYTLQPYSGPGTRYTCPGCGQKRTFTRYIITTTGEALPAHVGLCNRQNNCAYHFTPRQYFEQQGGQQTPGRIARSPLVNRKKISKPSFINARLLKQSLQRYNENCFVVWLIETFGDPMAARLVEDYLIGTSRNWPGATVFWQADAQGNIRTGKVMLYNAATGKRVKQPFSHITWVHSLLSRKPEVGSPKSDTITGLELQPNDFRLEQCLFGEHLLHTSPIGLPVAIAESEKTAIIASVYLPQFVWLAAGSLNNLNAANCAVLKNRNVTLFPDLNAYDKWWAKANELGMGFHVSALLEQNAAPAEHAAGLDLADYLLKYDLADFIANEILLQSPNAEIVEVNTALTPDAFGDLPEPLTRRWGPPPGFLWDVAKMERYFAVANMPQERFMLNACSVISHVPAFVAAHLQMVRHNNGKATFRPYWNRLVKLRGMLGGQVLKA
jgi:hypothetical protein